MRGQTIIEVIVAVAVFAVLSTSALFLILGSFESVRYGGEQEMALAFVSEGIDAARSIANQGWGKLLFGGPYGVSSVSGYWQLFGTGDTSGKFSRTINVDQVYRNGSGDIAPSGTFDPRTKKVTLQVNWETVVGRPNLISLISYFSLWSSLIWRETTTADFSDGTFTDTQVASIGDGAVTLSGAPGPGFACLSPTAFYDTPGVFDGQGVFVAGNRGYLVTDNNPGGREFYIFDLTNQEDPQLLGSLNLGAGGNGIVVSGNYAYIASEDNSQELKIIFVGIPSIPFQVGRYNTPGAADGLEVAVSGNYLYLVTENNATGSELYIFNIILPFFPILVGSLDIGETVNSIQVSDNYAYLATALNNAELTVVDITNPSSPTLAASLDLPSNADAADIFLLGSYLYIATDGAPGADFYVVDVTTPTAPTILGSLDIGGAGTAVTAYGQNAFVGTRIGVQNLITIIDITSPSNPQILSVSDAPEGWLYDLYYANNTLYGASAYNYGEFQIYEYETEISWRCHRQTGIYNTPGVSDGRDVWVAGNTAYPVTDNNPGAGPEFYGLNISDPENPTLSGSLNLAAGAYGIYVSGNYAYVASQHNSQELQIVNISNPASPTLVGSYNASGNTDASDVWVSGNYAYLTRFSSGAAELYKIDVTNPAAPTLFASVEIGADVYGIHIEGSYAYLATANNARELITVNLTPATPTVAGSYNTPGNADGKDVFVRGTVAYLVTNPVVGNEFYVLDVSTPSTPALLGSASWGGAASSAYSVIEDSGTAFVGTSTAGSAVKIFDVSNPTTPTLKSIITRVGDGALGLFYANDSLYVANANNNAEFQIYNKVTGGGGGGGGFTLSGYYVSSVFDATAGATWGFIFWTETLPVGADIQVQIKSAALLGDLGTAEWSGPEGKDGDETDWFTDAALEAIHADHEGDRFLQYRVYFTGPGTDTGVLEDMSIEYEV
jgi:hypothetical protein